MKRSGVNPGVHLTCGRFEDEIELCGVGCAFLCKETKQLEVRDCRSLAAVAGHWGESRPKGGNKHRRRECAPQTGGGLGLASMGLAEKQFKCPGTLQEHQVHSGTGIPWSGLVPESLEMGWCLLLCVVIRVIAIGSPVNPASRGCRL